MRSTTLVGEDPDRDRPLLTDDGRRWLERRAARLRQQMLHVQRRIEDDPDEREVAVANLGRGETELREIEWILQRAAPVESRHDDPTVVQMGDVAKIRFDDGSEETYVIVHGAEAHLDADRISSDSPLGRALLDAAVGETVTVDAPAGPYRCTIVSAARPCSGG